MFKILKVYLVYHKLFLNAMNRFTKKVRTKMCTSTNARENPEFSLQKLTFDKKYDTLGIK